MRGAAVHRTTMCTYKVIHGVSRSRGRAARRESRAVRAVAQSVRIENRIKYLLASMASHTKGIDRGTALIHPKRWESSTVPIQLHTRSASRPFERPL